MMNIRYKGVNLPFEYPFTISKGTKTHQPILVVALENRGFTGYGEAPAIYYYNATVEGMSELLEKKKSMIERFVMLEPDRFWHFLHHLLPNDPFLVCALDIAAWDMYGKMRKMPLHKLWGIEFDKGPLTDYTIGISSIDDMVTKMQAKPWPVYKVKLGTPEDIAIIEALRKNTDAVIRVDANAAWTTEEAIALIPALDELGVELIEQPLAKDNWEGMKKLYDFSPVPLMADESCVSEADVAKCKGHFHGINIKLTKCSGITPALRMIKEARNLNLKVMMGSMNESTLGSAAVAHFLPLLDYVDMDGPLLLKEDLATGLDFDFGKVSISGKPGLGVEMNDPF